MNIPQIREKVKKSVQKMVNKFSGKLTKPQGKFVMEMVSGILISRGINLTEIAKTLKEKTEVKHTLKRIVRMLKLEKILELANEKSLEEGVARITDRTVIALDGGDITHQYGQKFEKSSFVKDGSSGKIRRGYPLNQISGYNEKGKETFPILLEIYNTVDKWFKSANDQTIKLVDKLVSRIGSTGLWVIDRGYDGERILKYFLEKGLKFIVRMTKLRNIMFRGKMVNIKEAAKRINRRVKYNNNARFGYERVILKLGKTEYPMTLISYKDKRNKDIMFFLTNGWIKSSAEIKRRIRGYFKRWGVEECYRFEKQGFGIEKSIVRSYSGIKTLLGLSLMSWMVLIKINEDTRLKESVLKEAKMEKTKLKDRPNFIYYRLLTGIKEVFAGIKELFKIRIGRKERTRLEKNFKNELPPLFKIMNPCKELLQDWMLGAA